MIYEFIENNFTYDKNTSYIQLFFILKKIKLLNWMVLGINILTLKIYDEFTDILHNIFWVISLCLYNQKEKSSG